jgi:hypothetical protein
MQAETPSVPPKIAARPPLAFFTIVVLMLAILVSGAVLFFFDPARHGFYPVCLFHKLTGLNCPGCGATRAAYQLLHGHLIQALRDNALFILTLTSLVAWSAWLASEKIRNRPAAFVVSPRVLWLFLTATFVFTVLRNLPAFAWLSP